MKIDKWLVVSSSQTAKLFARKPPVNYDEIAIRLYMDIPDALFVRPTLDARIIVQEAGSAYSTINAEVIGQLTGAIHAATGLRVELSIKEPDDE